MNFLTNIHLNQNELQGAVIHKLAVEPAAVDGTKGQVYFNSTSNQLKYHDGTDWVAVGTSNADGDVTAIIGGTRISVTDSNGNGGLNGDVTVNLDSTTVSEIEANTLKVGITTAQASDITDNNAKISYTDAAAVGLNTAKNSYPSGDATKVGFLTVTQAVDLDTMESDIATNNAKTGISSAESTKLGHISVTQAVDLDTMESNIATNNAKTGITSQQATDITTNNAKVSFTKANLTSTLASYNGAETLTIGDSGNDTTVVIKGDLQIDGTTTTVNSTEVTFDDTNIVLASGSTAAQSTGAGLTVDGSNATLTYNNTGDKWEMNKDLHTDLVGNVTGDVTGNSDTATTLATPRNINGVSFDGSQDITITAVADAGTLSGTTLNSTVVTSSLTTIGTVTTGNVDAILPDAATNGKGIVERATDTEAKNTADTTRYVTPAHLGMFRYAEDIGAGTSHTCTHNLGTKDVHVSIYKVSDGAEVMCDITRTSTTVVTLGFGQSVSSGEYRVVVSR
ncbi:hypothetical protein [uncultured Mediterranean phage uvDeep-CGR2-KM19-C269]|nr:hypothetical protein [uncultured Mediterranean phage uvDeep-CGR2-KM19-C269]